MLDMLKITLKEIGGPNDGKVYVFDHHDSYQQALRNIVRRRFRSDRGIRHNVLSETKSVFYIVVEDNQVEFLEVDYVENFVEEP